VIWGTTIDSVVQTAADSGNIIVTSDNSIAIRYPTDTDHLLILENPLPLRKERVVNLELLTVPVA
jgi:hypothetical protein